MSRSVTTILYLRLDPSRLDCNADMPLLIECWEAPIIDLNYAIYPRASIVVIFFLLRRFN